MLPVLAHDLFLKPDKFFLKLNEKVSVGIFNGTFQSSEGAVSFARLTNVSVVSPSGARANPTEDQFTKNETTAYLNFEPKEAGNYVLGLSTAWRENQLPAKDFNEYLVLEGMPNILEDRKRDNELEIDGRYRYSKYVKTILQAGSKNTDSYKTILGYAVEMVPQQNPYSLRMGSTLAIFCIKDGKPLAGQIVSTGYEANGKLIEGPDLKSDKDGMIKVKIAGRGKWYAKFINMVKVTDPKLNYESKWATLTFGVK
jgi:hypothetical protein